MSSKKAEARERVKAMREEQARKDRAKERMMRGGIAVAVLIAVAVIAVAVISNRDGDDDVVSAVPEAASQVEGETGLMVGDPDAPVTIDNWMDFLCPHCRTFEQANGAQIDQWVEAGEVNVIYHPVTYTGGVNSTRANNAYACADAEGQGQEFLVAAFEQQQNWTNNALVSLGDDLGIGGDFGSCVRDGVYDSWSSSVTSAARDAGVEGTPAIFVNGEPVDNPAPEALAAAVQAAGGGEAPADDDASSADDDAADDDTGDEPVDDSDDSASDE